MKKKEMARKLWEMCFDDNPEFTDLYFRERYTDENTIAVFEEDEMISVLQLLPYPFLWKNVELDSAYISGACTHGQHRNKGAMHKLLADSLNHLAKTNVPICTLIPAEEWLFDYYQKSGFETLFYNAHYNFDLPSLEMKDDIIVTFSKDFCEESYTYFDSKMRERETVILHPKEDMEVVLADLTQADGAIFTARKDRKLVGIAFAYADNKSKTVFINEILTDECSIKQEIFKAVAKYYGYNKVSAIAPAYHLPKQKFGMLRVVLALPLLRIYAKSNPDWSDRFILEDALVPENNGTYTIEKGRVNFEPTLKKKIKKINSNDLAVMLFKDSEAYMSLMLD